MREIGAPAVGLVLFGPPGAGKGWIAKLVKERYSRAEYFASGDHFRGLMRAGSQLGSVVQRYVSAGDLIPNDIVLAEITQMFKAGKFAHGFVFDGFPRTTAQANALDALLAAFGRSPVQAAVFLDVPEEVSIERLRDRTVCPGCAAVYNMRSKPPETAGMCDMCRSPLEERADDQPHVIRNRLEIYRRQTLGIVDHYSSLGILTRVDGTRAPEISAEEVVALLEAPSGIPL